MAGNSKRKGAIRKGGTKKGQTVGSGGQRRRGLEGRGATPKAVDRPYHSAHKRAKAAAKTSSAGAGRPQRKAAVEGPEYVLGRNPVVECLRAGVPATALYVVLGADADERVTEAVQIAGDKGIAILEVQRPELDRMSSNGMHQGIALQVPPYRYAHPTDLMQQAIDSGQPPLLVALDTSPTHVTSAP